ncbi:Serine/threonine-protein kinase ppk30 [Termitomyces sp. J132]|nr:Serine/threonine-protein kinase ppk30 [Termitomyces sp. J132]
MQQAHNAYVQNKGTLAPGQSILVNKFTVQVERYLSQGGFAHVYLVRTPTPVYNTTHHVLKRIAVANEGMLAEVKKEVDVMRLLKGHPNIVHLIDAAWHKMESGMYEVFILMEYCGGIIDMMNRRLRERLTEAEILQIFVDVCEGVACMHNVRPPLLHRDLKVENILQSSPTSYKLCDFGSATTVSRPPATTQEIRTLESDLNRYTTLQYRAPEMIDVYSRRPIDEKSDVWALGVLLYKLCYYTTPFEEHGQLAILNVQYKIPPYPVYSPQMNQLIASMLQEHGVRRPSVFEILDHVHRLRGTKSRFKYSIPAQNPLPLRQQTTFNVSPSSIVRRELSVPRPNRVEMSVSPSRQGVQVREKVMEDIVPLRRGDQVPSKTPETSPSTPNLQPAVEPQFLRRGRPPIRDSTRTELKPDSWATSIPLFGNGAPTDAWYIGGDKPRLDNAQEMNIGFGDDFAAKIGDKVVTDKLPSQTHLNTKKLSPSSPTRFQQPLGINKRTSPEKDAFDGLGLLSAEKPEPTLAEARKLRTGLAIMHNNGFRTNPDRPLGMHRPTPSPRLPLSSPLQLYPPSTASLTPNISKALSPSPKLSPHPAPDKGIFLQSDGTPAESRFPSLEELDSGFSVPIPSQLHPTQDGLVSLTRRNGILGRPGAATKDTQGSDSTNLPRSKTPVDSRREEIKPISGSRSRDENDNGSRSDLASKHARPALIDDVNHRLNTTNLLQDADPSSKVHTSSPRLPTRMKPIDWLTGDDDGHTLGVPSSSHLVPPAPDGTPVLRDSPSKRASLILNNEIIVQSAAVAEHDHIERPPLLTTQISSKFTRSFPPIDGFDKLAKEPQARPNLAMKPTPSTSQDSSGSSGDEGPEDAVGIIRPVRKTQTERRGHKGRQNSVHDLVDLYGGGLSQKDKERETPTARPLNLDPGSNTQSQKHHSIAPPKPTKPQSSSLSAVSNTSLPSHSTSTAVSGRSPSNEQRTTSTSGPSSSPSRPRPQSMFIFPSKSVDSFPLSSSQPLPSPELAPPEDIKHRDVRRTSISDIVQHYEDIRLAENDVLPPKPPLKSEKERAKSSVSLPVGDYVSSRRPKSPTESNILPTVPITSRPIPIRHPTESNLASATPVHGRPVAIRHNTLNKGSDVIPPSTPLNSEAVRVTKFPTSSTTDGSLSHAERVSSSSPERPYQGVSKLIDQWQKKTAEAESSRTVRGRGTFTAKQSKIVPDSSV